VAPYLRAYEPDDLEQLYVICLRTGAAGQDATDLVGDPRLFGELYAAPYGVLEPEHALVVDDGTGRAAGYVLGALDTREFEARCEAEWRPALRDRHPIGSGGTELDELLIAMIHEPHTTDDDLLDAYPSHLHIDLLPELQGCGWGRRLMAAMEQLLAADGSPGVHLGTSLRNERAIAFYRHLGYEELGTNGISVDFGRTFPPSTPARSGTS
jgi:ribosomal protein S18 acetylase RimI-like enzyme